MHLSIDDFSRRLKQQRNENNLEVLLDWIENLLLKIPDLEETIGKQNIRAEANSLWQSAVSQQETTKIAEVEESEWLRDRFLVKLNYDYTFGKVKLQVFDRQTQVAFKADGYFCLTTGKPIQSQEVNLF